MIFGPEFAHRLVGDRGDQRRDDNHLRDNHRGGCEQQPHDTKRARPRQQQIDDQPDHHGRQAHQCIQRGNGGAAIPKPTDRQPGAKRQGKGRRDDKGGQTDLKRAGSDFHKVRIKRDNKPECGLKAGPYLIHCETALTGCVWSVVEPDSGACGTVLARKTGLPQY